MWMVVHTKTHQEKKAELNLINQGYTTYLPSFSHKKYINSDWITKNEVLFKSYLFVKYTDSMNLSPISYTKGIIKLLLNRSTGSPYFLSDSLIQIIKSKSMSLNSNNINTLQRGSKVYISNIGKEFIDGVFLEKSSSTRARVLIYFLNQTRQTYVDIDTLYTRSPL